MVVWGRRLGIGLWGLGLRVTPAIGRLRLRRGRCCLTLCNRAAMVYDGYACAASNHEAGKRDRSDHKGAHEIERTFYRRL